MFSTSKCLLKNRKLLEAISCKVQNVATLHVCKNHRSFNRRKILDICGSHRYSGFLINPVYAARSVSTRDASVQASSAEILTDVTVSSNTNANVSSESNTSTTSPSVETISDSAVKTSAVSQQEIGSELIDFPIPDPPTPPVKIIDGQIIDGLLVDPPFSELGLGGWTPVGWVQSSFEYLHVGLGIPWWECIVIGTICVRAALFPLLVISQRNSALLQNHQLEFQELQAKVNEAQQRGEQIEAARHTQDLVLFMKKTGINPIKNAFIPLCQAPIFISFFMGLREMANIPLKSMHEGGLFWFTDLTVPDQFYLLPIITSLTLWTTIEIGADSSKLTSQNQALVKYILRGIPIVMLPFTINFPSAILMYWTSTNIISLLQVALFQLPKVRTFLKIEQKKKVDTEKLPVKSKGVLKSIKNWWYDTKTRSQLGDRARKNQVTFNQAGRGAVPKTYKYNPTLPRPTHSSPAASIQAKKQ